MKTRSVVLAILLVLASGCEGNGLRAREKGALGGAALGAGLGAIVGNQVGNTGAGIAIGSAFGALSGAVIGNEFDNNQANLDERQGRLQEQQKQLDENRRMIDELRGGGLDVRQTDRGVVVNLPDVLFEFNRSELLPSSRRTTAEIAHTIKGVGGNRHIAVEGHTDSIGSIAYNQRLSEERARSVAEALASNGITRRQIVTRGLGEGYPIASNNNAAGRSRNRRVEVIIENR